jgi:hypothetical protein
VVLEHQDHRVRLVQQERKDIQDRLEVRVALVQSDIQDRLVLQVGLVIVVRLVAQVPLAQLDYLVQQEVQEAQVCMEHLVQLGLLVALVQ